MSTSLIFRHKIIPSVLEPSNRNRVLTLACLDILRTLAISSSSCLTTGCTNVLNLSKTSYDLRLLVFTFFLSLLIDLKFGHDIFFCMIFEGDENQKCKLRTFRVPLICIMLHLRSNCFYVFVYFLFETTRN